MPHHPNDNQHVHLQISREGISPQRRSRQGFGAVRPNRGGRDIFAPQLLQATNNIINAQAQKPTPPAGIQPHLVFRAPLAQSANVDKISDLLQQAGLIVVSVEPDRAIVAFRSDADLSEFQHAIQNYQQGPRINPKTRQRFTSTKYDVLEFLEPQEMKLWSRSDRVGIRLAEVIGTSGDRIEAERIYIVEIELWHLGTRPKAQQSIEEIRQFINDNASNQERFLDQFVGNTLVLAKGAITGEKLNRLLDLDVVAEIELPLVAIFDPLMAARTPARAFPTPPLPPADGPRVCVIDTGIISNHPLLGSNVGHEEAILTEALSPADSNGHGTMVGALAVFGDVRSCYEAGQFSSPITLFSARVLNENNEFDNEKLIINQLRQAIETFTREPYNCRIFNISIGGREAALGNGIRHQNYLAEALDILARELQVVIVVSAGNHDEIRATNAEEAEEVLNSYPSFLLRQTARLCDFATAAIPITVGALAQYDDVAIRYGLNAEDIRRLIAKADQPAPMSRVGPGVQGAIKPEFVHYGGSPIFDRAGPRHIRTDEGTSVMSFSHEPLQRLFAYNIGTSFAAPRVARLAALVHHKLRQDLGIQPHPNLVRAILGASATLPVPTQELFENNSYDAIKVCGYGLPDEDFALHSWDRHTTLFAQEQITPEHFHIYRIPIPDAFRLARGTRSITVTLAYDPPVRRRRLDYLGIEMDMVLIRGMTPQEVSTKYRKLSPNEEIDRSIPSACLVNLEPKAQSRIGQFSRKKSTLQRATFTMKQAERRNYGDEYVLLIRAERKWADIDSQTYAIVVTLAADASDLYTQVQQRIQQRVRIRV